MTILTILCVAAFLSSGVWLAISQWRLNQQLRLLGENLRERLLELGKKPISEHPNLTAATKADLLAKGWTHYIPPKANMGTTLLPESNTELRSAELRKAGAK